MPNNYHISSRPLNPQLHICRSGNNTGGTSHGIAVPEIGRWYRRPDGSTFEVVAIDETDITIELQHFDGTVEEVDYYGWVDLKANRAMPPEDWSGSVDITTEDMQEPEHFVTLTLDDSLNLIEQVDDPSEDWLSVITVEKLN